MASHDFQPTVKAYKIDEPMKKKRPFTAKT